MSSTMEPKLAVIGTGGVGKSALTIQMVSGVFVDFYDPTIEDSYLIRRTIDDVAYSINILDTAGQDDYAALWDMYYKNADGYLIVYDITKCESFEEARNFYDRILRIRDCEPEDLVVVLVGNKTDLENDRAVTTSEGQNLADRWNAAFFETSAKQCTNVAEAFDELIARMVPRRYGQGYLKKKCPHLLGLYQTRFFAIKGKNLYYYHTDLDSKPLGYIPLNYSQGLKSIRWTSGRKSCSFVIELDGRSFELIAHDPITARNWVQRLDRIAYENSWKTKSVSSSRKLSGKWWKSLENTQY